jgi:hypothetical protein
MSLHNLVWELGEEPNVSPLDNDFTIWSPGEPIPLIGERILIGVARWSRYDHRLLSLLESLPRSICRIDLFDADRCQSQEAVRDYIPIDFVHHTPFVGFWRDGKLIESENGYAGRHLIYRVLGLDPATADDFVIHGRTPSTV